MIIIGCFELFSGMRAVSEFPKIGCFCFVVIVGTTEHTYYSSAHLLAVCFLPLWSPFITFFLNYT